MFSVRLITADSYQAAPLSLIDPTYSEFRGAEIKNVPIIRVFGTTPTGEKACLHLHGAFPYMYVPFTGEYNADIYPYKLAVSLDTAINVSLGLAMSNTQHIYRIEHVAGIPFYGYHEHEHRFLKVYFYNPAMLKRATDLLQNGSVLNVRLQPHEAHVPYILQFMIDNNLHGMSFINLSNVKYRSDSQLLSKTEPSDDSVISPMQIVEYLPSSIIRQSVCQFEVDALVSDIQNRQELLRGIDLNPGLATIWKEERVRRIQAGLPSDDSQLVNPISPKRSVYHDTESDIHQQQRLNRRLLLISQSDESTISKTTVRTPYPLEVNDDNHLIHASNLESYNQNNTNNRQQNLSDVDNLMSINVSQIPDGVLTQNSSSLLNPEDVRLIEMLIELARDSSDRASIDDNSVLGTQTSMLDEAVDIDGIEDEDDMVDLNITCSELDQMSLCDDIEKSPSQLVKSPSRSDTIPRDINCNSHGSAGMSWPQLDGVDDEWNSIESDEDEGVTGYAEFEHVAECQTSRFAENSLANGDDGAFIADIHDFPTITRIYNTCLASVSYEKNFERFGTMNYDILGLVLDSNYHFIKHHSLLGLHRNQASVGISMNTFFDTSLRCVNDISMGSQITHSDLMIKVKPIVGEFAKIIDTPTTNESALAENNIKYFSCNSLTHSNSGVISREKCKHSYSYYTLMCIEPKREFGIWRSATRERRGPRPLLLTVCNRRSSTCVQFQELDMIESAELYMDQEPIVVVHLQKIHVPYYDKKINKNEDNDCANDTSGLHEMAPADLLGNVRTENLMHVIQHEGEVFEGTQANYKMDVTKCFYVNRDEEQLPRNSFVSRLSALPSFIRNQNGFPAESYDERVAIKRIHDGILYRENIGRGNRSVILKCDSKNGMEDVDLKGNMLEIVAFSIKKKNKNKSENMCEDRTQPGFMTEIREQKNDNVFSIPPTTRTNLPESLLQDEKMMNRDDTKIADIELTLNMRSAIISSPHSELSILLKHSNMWCWIDQKRIDFVFITSKNNTKNRINSVFLRSLISVRDQVVTENNRMKSAVDVNAVPKVKRTSEDDGVVESMTIDHPEFTSNGTAMATQNVFPDCHELLNDERNTIRDDEVDRDDDNENKDHEISESIHESKIVKMNSHVDRNHIANEYVKDIDEGLKQDCVLKFGEEVTNKVSEKNTELYMEKTELSRVSKFDGQFKQIGIKCAIVLDSSHKSLTGNIVGRVDKKRVPHADCIQIRNDQLIMNLSTNEVLIVHKPNVKAISYTDIRSVGHVDEVENFRTKSEYRCKRSDMPISNIRSCINNSKKCIAYVTSRFGCCQNNGKFLRSYKTSTDYQNYLHTVSINQIMVLIKSMINEQELWMKSAKGEYSGNIGLYLLKPRRLAWSSEYNMVGLIQYQQPYVALRCLASSVSEYFDYSRRLRTNAFSYKFEATVNKHTVPAFDGPADLSSSDSEPDADPTEIDLEKRVCMYRLLKKEMVHESVITSKKRKLSHSDDYDEIGKRKWAKRCTIQESSGTVERTSCSTHKCMLRIPNVSENYSPLEIMVNSPTVCKVIHNYSDKSRFENPGVFASTNSVCIMPNGRKRMINEETHRTKIVPPATDERGNICNLRMNIQQRFMDTRKNNPGIQRPAVLSRRQWKSQDIYSNVRAAVNISNSEKKDDRDIVSTMFNQNIIEIWQSNSISTHTGELHTEEYNLCNDSLTQYLRSRKSKPSSLPCSIRGEILSESRQSLCIIPRLNPPLIKRIIDTLKIYDMPEFENSQPFFSNYADAPEQKEVVHKMLNVPGKSVINLSIFKSNMETITGLNYWRRMKINEFYLGHRIYVFGGKSESKSLRQSLAGNGSVVIVPLLSAPKVKNVIKWYKLRDYSKTVQEKREAVTASRNQMKKIGENMDVVKSTLKIECLNASDSNVSGGSLEKKTVFSWAKLGRTPNIRKKDAANFQARSVAHDIVGVSIAIPRSNEGVQSLEGVFAKSTLFKKTAQSEKFGISCGQIDCLPHTIKSDVVNENMQNCRTLTRYQFITIFCVEVHVNTRHDLLPNPQYDQISALFYAIRNDVPPTSSRIPLNHGVISISTEGETESNYWYGSEIPFAITCVADEKELFDTFMDIVNSSDAELLIGWEIESLSWGYILQRASWLGINLIKGMSRVSTSQWNRDNQISDNFNSLADMKLPGRIVLDIWRIMKSEVALLTYTFENVMYHVMNERLPCPSFKSLTTWWQSIPSRWRVVQHYSRMILGILRILEQLDIIGRTSEFARLFGIQFYEVFSRGSQYRVESLMLRLAKPLNYVTVSPSPQQRSSMRAMEALPLIMEPESMFYSDPVVVLDFQSLYPSIIIAHNYCYSTCLGRVEHIGQPEPFEFGASALRIPKHTALKLRGKVNYAPCGVAFVKPEVRFGILPRMLTEILNTRLMVKNAMKDHSQDDKLLQRVLHSRQKGLKDLANVTYGYTAANFTGRMPCVEVGDSVISKAKETLERAIKLVESMPQWGARVIYGDTDSLFILVPGKSKSDAFNIGYEIANAVTASNLSPIKLKFEKILYPAILQSKKRYCGYMYETPDQSKPKFLAKGIETVRRDGCPAVSKILEKSLRILFDTKDVSLLKQYVTRQLNKVLNGKVSLEDLTFAKEFRGINGYKEHACVPALELSRRLLKKDPRALPRRNERVRYVIIAGAPNQALIHCVRSPWELINDSGLRVNGVYYVTRVIIPPLNRCLSLMGVDVNMWYKEMTHRQLIQNPVVIPEHKQKQTISQYFGTIVCVSCGRTSNREICNDCLSYPIETSILLHERLRWLERINNHITTICQSCVSRGHIVDCVSLDCPVLYRRYQAQRDLTQGTILQKMIQAGDVFNF